MKIRCFVCANGHVWTINHEGQTNYPADIRLVGDTVQILGESDDLGPGRAIEGEYQLWNSLTELALCIEYRTSPVNDNGVSLEQAVSEELHKVIRFEKEWVLNHAERPEQYPMVIPRDNAGVWFEQIREFESE